MSKTKYPSGPMSLSPAILLKMQLQTEHDFWLVQIHPQFLIDWIWKYLRDTPLGMFWFCFVLLFIFFETRFRCVVLTVLELTL